MNMTRCDKCCDVIDGIDDGEVFELSQEAQKEIGFSYEHLCKDCFNEVNSDCITLKLDKKDSGYALIKTEKED